jgi:hypothetical protein
LVDLDNGATGDRALDQARPSSAIEFEIGSVDRCTRDF